MSKKKKILILIAILIIVVLIIMATYSKYYNEANAVVQEKIGQWVIKVNDVDITGSTQEFTISDFTWDWSSTPHVKSPKVAPGMTGSFSLNVDPTGTDVSVKYTFTIDESALTKLADINLKVTGITLNGTALTITEEDSSDDENTNSTETESEESTAESTVKSYPLVVRKSENNSDNIVIEQVKKLETIKSETESDRVDNWKIEVTWENEDTDESNKEDSIVGSVANTTISMPVTIDVIQYTGD